LGSANDLACLKSPWKNLHLKAYSPQNVACGDGSASLRKERISYVPNPLFQKAEEISFWANSI
jgi:hypothetical protein